MATLFFLKNRELKSGHYRHRHYLTHISVLLLSCTTRYFHLNALSNSFPFSSYLVCHPCEKTSLFTQMSTGEISCHWKSFIVSFLVFLIHSSVNVYPTFSLLLFSFALFSHFSILPLIGMKHGPSFTSLLFPLPLVYNVWSFSSPYNFYAPSPCLFSANTSAYV